MWGFTLTFFENVLDVVNPPFFANIPSYLAANDHYSTLDTRIDHIERMRLRN